MCHDTMAGCDKYFEGKTEEGIVTGAILERAVSTSLGRTHSTRGPTEGVLPDSEGTVFLAGGTAGAKALNTGQEGGRECHEGWGRPWEMKSKSYGTAAQSNPFQSQCDNNKTTPHISRGLPGTAPG